MGTLMAILNKGRLLAINITLGWKWLALTKAQAYNTAVIIYIAKSFIVRAQIVYIILSLSPLTFGGSKLVR